MNSALETTLGVRVHKRDRVRLQPHLSGWNHLNEILLLEDFTLEELKMLLLIEIEGNARKAIMDRLVARIKKVERTELVKAIMERGRVRRAGKTT